MKGIFGAPATGVPVSDVEDRMIRIEGREYSREMMENLLSELTPEELLMKSGGDPADYDYAALSSEKIVFAPGQIVHILRHLRYDRHKPHSHGFFEIICQANGRAEAVISERRVNLEPGMICILSPETVHNIEANSDESTTFKVIMQRTDFDAIYRQLLQSDTKLAAFFTSTLYGKSGGFLIFRAGGDEELTDLLYRMRYHEVRRAPTDAMMKQSLVIRLFCILAERHDASTESFGEDLAGKLLSEMRMDFRNVTLSSLSNKFHFTPGYVGRVLKRAGGRSFSELIDEMRLNHALALLEATRLSIDDIAVESGFGCREFFHRKFREKYGISPSKWRRNLRNAADSEEIDAGISDENELSDNLETVGADETSEDISKSPDTNPKNIDVALL